MTTEGLAETVERMALGVPQEAQAQQKAPAPVAPMKRWAVAVSLDTVWEGRHWWSSTITRGWMHLFFITAPDEQVAEAMAITRAANSHWAKSIELEVNINNALAREIPTP